MRKPLVSRFLGRCLQVLSAWVLVHAPAWACGPYALAYYEIGSLYFRDAEGHEGGIDKDLIDELVRRSGCRIETRIESRVRIWLQLEHGGLDLSVSAIPTPERERYGWFLPYYRTRNFALLRHDLADRYPNAASFLADAERRAVVVRGFRHGASFDTWVDQLRSQGRVSEVPDFPAALRVLRAAKADLVISAPVVMARAQQQETWLQDFRLVDWAPNDLAVGALIGARARVSETDRQLLQRHLREMYRDGSLTAILRKHLGSRALEQSQVEPMRP